MLLHVSSSLQESQGTKQMPIPYESASNKAQPELGEEEVDVADGAELCDEGLRVLQENLLETNRNSSQMQGRFL